MELKLFMRAGVVCIFSPLIVPYGIETLQNLMKVRHGQIPLIVPYGIETRKI